MLRVVLDTNVLVSALLSSGGICNQIIRRWVTGLYPPESFIKFYLIRVKNR